MKKFMVADLVKYVEDPEMDAEDISGYGISGTLSIMGTQKYKDESTGEYKEL